MKKKLNLKSHQQLHTHRDTRKWKTEIFWFQINKISMNTRYRRIGWNDSNDENKKTIYMLIIITHWIENELKTKKKK